MASKRAPVKSAIGCRSKKKKKVESSDDDFETVVPVKRANKKDVPGKGKDPMLIDEDGDEVICRCSPDHLMKALTRMNKKQKRAIYDMGFANLYHIGVNEIPEKFAQWCLTAFEPVSSSLLLPNNRRLHISEEDVWLSLGIPRGTKKIISKAKRITSPILESWVADVGKPKKSITVADVELAMNRDSEGGVWFKRHFAVLVEACLFEHAADGYIKPKILENLIDVTDVRNLNWCEYMLRQLFHHHESWKSNKKNLFTGPILFLLIVYVDRVVYCQRQIDRVFPTVKGWDSNILRTRMKTELADGGMGLGYMDERYDPSVQFKECGNEFGEEVIEGDDDDDTGVDEAEAYTHKVLTTAKSVADSMESLSALIKEASVHVCQMTDWTDCLERVKDILQPHEDFISTMGYPSFSMGFTQDPILNREDDEGDMNEEGINVDVAGETEENSENTGSGVNPHAYSENAKQANEPGEGYMNVESVNVGSGGFESNEDNCNDPMAGLTTPCTTLEMLDDMGPNTFDDILKKATTSGSGPNESNIPDETIRNVVKDLNATMFANEGTDKTSNEHSGVPISTDAKDGTVNTGPGTQTKNQDDNPQVGTTSVGSVEKDKGKGKKIPIADATKINAKGKSAATKISPVARRMKTRTAKEKKKAASLLSPYNRRAVVLNDKLDANERDIYYWIITDTTIPDDAVHYDDDAVTCMMGDIRTFKPASYLSSNVMNVWSSCLNWREKYKSAESPTRFFFTTYPCSFTVVDQPADWDERQIRNAFCERVHDELDKFDGFRIQKCDLVFFPICHSMHYYVVCISMSNYYAVILDNSPSMIDEDLTVKYGDVPNMVVKCFGHYLRMRSFQTKGNNVAASPLTKLRMPWQSEINKTDCGIYAMRHMETFMGTKVNNWDAGFKKRSKKQMRFLRAKYCAAILSAEQNDHSVDNIEATTAHYKRRCVSEAIDVEKFVMNYQPPQVDKPPPSSANV